MESVLDMNARRVSYGFLLAGLAGAAAAIFLTWQFLSERSAVIEVTKQAAREEARSAAAEIGTRVEKAAAAVESIAGEVSAGELARGTVTARLREAVEQFPLLQDAGVVWASAGAELLVREGDSHRAAGPEALGDYASEPWYADAISDGGGWREPFEDPISGYLITRYSAPFYRTLDGQREPSGAVFVSARFQGAERRFDVFSSSARGWGMLLSKQGYALIHPESRLVRQRHNIFDNLENRDDPELTAAVKRALSGESILIESESQVTGQSSWFFSEPVPGAGWAVVVVRVLDEVLPEDRAFRQAVIRIVSFALFGFIGLAVWASMTMYRRTGREPALWIAVFLVSLVLAIGVGAIRRVTFNQVSEEDVSVAKIQDRSALASFLHSQTSERPSLRTLPTGIYVESVKFTTPREVMVTGYVWQKFAAGETVPERPQFLLPDAYEPTIEEAYRRREDGYEVVGWHFESLLRQKLDVSRYPFDHDILSVRLWPADPTGGVLLEPDLASYVYTNPTALPGTKQNLDIPGWMLSGCYFDYQFREYNVDFGLSRETAQRALPELRFNMSVKRNLLDPAIQNFVPIAVILIMLFAVIVTTTSDVEESKLLGFNPSGTMRITSALFFVTLVAHIQLRNTLQTHDIVFMEYSYFTVYLALLVTAVHRFLFLMPSIRIQIVEYRSSLILKLLYWPVILALQFIITAALFY